MACRLKFWHFFTEKPIVVKPVQSTLNQVVRRKILNKTSNISYKVKKYINTYLKPSSGHFSKFFLTMK